MRVKRLRVLSNSLIHVSSNNEIAELGSTESECSKFQTLPESQLLALVGSGVSPKQF
jgi:hypothetical protein